MFDFLKRRGQPAPKIWQSPGITFLSEKTGPAEDQLKSALSERFATDRRIRRAYLVRVSYPNSGPQRSKDENRGPQGLAEPVEVVLCVSAPEDVTIVEAAGEEFHKIFHASQHMDVMFLTEAQEGDVSRVAQPFYRAT